MTVAQRKERTSTNHNAASQVSIEQDNTLALLSQNNPSVVPEVPENMETENDMSFHVPAG